MVGVTWGVIFKSCKRFKSSTWTRLLRSRNIRGSRRATRKRSDEEWYNTKIGPIRGMNLKPLIENQQHTTVWLKGYRYAASATTVVQKPFIEGYFQASKNSFSVMTIGTRTSSFLCLLREASTVLRKSKLFPLEQLVSFQETHSWQCRYVPSLIVADSTNTKYVCVRVYLQNNPSDKKRFGSEKRKRKYFFFSVFPRDQRHTPNYPALYMCMPLTIRVR
jgi:hypothetical protein